MKKKLIILTILLLLLTSLNSFAEGKESSISLIRSETTYLSNGYKFITNTYLKNINRSTVSSQKETNYVDPDNVILWKVTLIGTFTYNGFTSSCTSASSYSTVYQGNWSESNNNTFASGNAAVASVTMVRKFLFITVETQVVNLTITCDKDGNVQ